MCIMTDSGSSTKIVVDETVALSVSIIGFFAVTAAAYHAATTGNPGPLFAATSGLLIVVLFITSEQ